MIAARRLGAIGFALLVAVPAMGETAGGPVRDGVYPTRQTSEMVDHPDPACPGLARFRQDSIEYTEWANQRVVSTWTNTTETFMMCLDSDSADPTTTDPAR